VVDAGATIVRHHVGPVKIRYKFDYSINFVIKFFGNNQQLFIVSLAHELGLIPASDLIALM